MEEHDPFDYYLRKFNPNYVQWRPKKNYELDERGAEFYYDRGLKKLREREEELKRDLEWSPRDVNAMMEF